MCVYVHMHNCLAYALFLTFGMVIQNLFYSWFTNVQHRLIFESWFFYETGCLLLIMLKVAKCLLLSWLDIFYCWKSSSKSEAQKMYSILHNYTLGNHHFCLLQVECCCLGGMNYSFVTGGQTINVKTTVDHGQKHIQWCKTNFSEFISSIIIQS